MKNIFGLFESGCFTQVLLYISTVYKYEFNPGHRRYWFLNNKFIMWKGNQYGDTNTMVNDTASAWSGGYKTLFMLN